MFSTSSSSSIFITSKNNTRPMACAAAPASPTNRTDYYNLLSVRGGRNATTEEIKRAYRTMALQYHPDRVCDPLLKEQSTRMFVQLNAAYETLSDPVLRREYDQSVMTPNFNPQNRVGYDFDRAVWHWQLLELQRRSSLRMDRSAGFRGGRKQTSSAL